MEKRSILYIIILLCAGFIIYSNTLNGSFQFDDYGSIVDNSTIRDLSNLKAIWDYWPTRFITFFSFALNYYFGYLNVFGYHFLNLIIHVCSSVLVWYLALLTFSAPAIKREETAEHAGLIAFFSSLIFVTHPIQTQAVSYITQRTTSLATFFYLASICCYIKARLSENENNPNPDRKFYYAISAIAAVLAMFTKETAITLPIAILLYEIYFLKTKKGIKWKPLFPFLIMILIIPITMFATKSVNFLEMRRSAEGAPSISTGNYLLTQFRVSVTYIGLLLIPVNQTVDYDYPVAKTLLNVPTLTSLLLIVAIIVTAVRLFRKYKPISFAILWFFLTLLPESSIIPIEDVIFEHRLYLPMVGFSIFLAYIIYYVFKTKMTKLTIALLIIIVALYSILTYNRNFVWKNELSLWDDAASKSPHKARVYNNRGRAYSKKGDVDRALRDFEKAIELDPIGDAGYYFNRAGAYFLKGDIDRTISDYTKTIQMKPDYVKAYNNRGSAYYKKDKFDEAISDFTRAIALDPGFIPAYQNRAAAYFKKKDYEESWRDVQKVEALGGNVPSDFLSKLEKARNL